MVPIAAARLAAGRKPQPIPTEAERAKTSSPGNLIMVKNQVAHGTRSWESQTPPSSTHPISLQRPNGQTARTYYVDFASHSAKRSNDNLARLSPSVREAVREIRELMEGITGIGDEERILEILGTAKGNDLDVILSRLDLVALVSDIDDHFWPWPKNRQALFDLLTRDRLKSLSIPTRASFVHALQVGFTDEQKERAIRDVFLGTTGSHLTELKNRIDGGDDHRDLQQLLFHDIDNEDFRADILTHICREATPPPSGLDIKLLSDVDDTLYASLKDTRLPKGTVYPGLVALYRALAPSPGDGQTNLTILTARPRIRIGTIERYTKNALREKGIPESTILSGDFLSLLDNERMAAKKIENFEQYLLLYPEYRFIWNGDSGQGDRQVGLRMLEKYGERIVAVSIHAIGAGEANVPHDAIADYSTYPGLALVLYRKGLLNREQLFDVIQSAAAAPTDGFSTEYVETLSRDIDAARLAARVAA